MSTAKYKFLPHTTDAYIEATGRSFEEALENAGLALFETMCNINSIEQKLDDLIVVDGDDKVELLFSWLEALLLKFELEQKVYSAFEVAVEKTTQGLRMTAHARGELFNREKHGAKVEVKAVTYHRMEVLQEGSLALVRFILDL